jgi:hypothetical protein
VVITFDAAESCLLLPFNNLNLFFCQSVQFINEAVDLAVEGGTIPSRRGESVAIRCAPDYKTHGHLRHELTVATGSLLAEPPDASSGPHADIGCHRIIMAIPFQLDLAIRLILSLD